MNHSCRSVIEGASSLFSKTIFSGHLFVLFMHGYSLITSYSRIFSLPVTLWCSLTAFVLTMIQSQIRDVIYVDKRDRWNIMRIEGRIKTHRPPKNASRVLSAALGVRDLMKSLRFVSFRCCSRNSHSQMTTTVCFDSSVACRSWVSAYRSHIFTPLNGCWRFRLKHRSQPW